MTIQEFVDLAKRVHDQERMNFGASSSRESRNADWARIVGIAHHGSTAYGVVADPQWHLKNGGGGRPQSDDVVTSMPSRMAYDCIPGSGADGYRFEASGGFVLPDNQVVYAPPVPSGGGGQPQPLPSLWSDSHQAMLNLLVANGKVTTGHIAQHFAFVWPLEGWSQKKASQDRPASADVIARRDGGRLLGYKVVPAPSSAPAQWDITGQVPVSVIPTNQLGSAQVPPPVPPSPTPPVQPPAQPPPPVPTIPTALLEVLVALDVLSEKMDQHALRLAALLEDIDDAASTRVYVLDASAKYLGKVSGTITPRKD